MTTITVNVQELPARWQELMARAASGEEIIVADGNMPQARLLPLPSGQARVPGLHPGAFQITDDFDAELPEDFWLGSS